MFNKLKKYVSYFCLTLYVLFGFLNTGWVGVCAGVDNISHFGLNVFGYESCCHKEHKHVHNSSASTSTIISLIVLPILYNIICQTKLNIIKVAKRFVSKI